MSGGFPQEVIFCDASCVSHYLTQSWRERQIPQVGAQAHETAPTPDASCTLWVPRLLTASALRADRRSPRRLLGLDDFARAAPRTQGDTYVSSVSYHKRRAEGWALRPGADVHRVWSGVLRAGTSVPGGGCHPPGTWLCLPPWKLSDPMPWGFTEAHSLSFTVSSLSKPSPLPGGPVGGKFKPPNCKVGCGPHHMGPKGFRKAPR